MAETPVAPQATSSYSDPLYDRLEGLVNTLGRKWWVIVVIAILSAVITVMVVKEQQRSPEAASAAAYVDARNDLALLEGLVGDEAITPEYRAQAAIAAAQLKLDEGDVDAADAMLEKAQKHAASAGVPALKLAVDASRGAVAETRSDWDAARAAYNAVLDGTTQTKYPGLNLAATLGAARVELSAAAESNDPAEAFQMRRDARALLEFAVGATPDGNYGNYEARIESYAQSMAYRSGQAMASAVDLGAAARFLLADLDRKHPNVRDDNAVAPEAVEEAAAPEDAAEDAAADAPAEVEVDSAPADDAAPEDAAAAE